MNNSNNFYQDYENWRNQTRMFDPPQLKEEERKAKVIKFLEEHSVPMDKSLEEKRKEWAEMREKSRKWLREHFNG